MLFERITIDRCHNVFKLCFIPVESLSENRTSDLPYGPPSDSSTSTLAQPVSLDVSEPSSVQVTPFNSLLCINDVPCLEVH